MPDTSGLMTKTVLNRKTNKVENKVLIVSSLVQKTDYDAKIKEIERKYFTTANYKKITSEILEIKVKQEKLDNKFDVD